VENLSFNVHLLTHLSTSVVNWGPLWVHSTFIFEDANGLFQNLFHGTQAVHKQICNTFLTLGIIKRVDESVSCNIPECACDFIDKCLNIEVSRRSKRTETFSLVVCIGSFAFRNLTVQELFALETRMQLRYERNSIKVFDRLFVNGIFVTSDAYAARFFRDDAYVMLKTGVMCSVLGVCVFTCIDNCVCACLSERFLLLCKYNFHSRVGYMDRYVEDNLSYLEVCIKCVIMACVASDVERKVILLFQTLMMIVLS